MRLVNLVLLPITIEIYRNFRFLRNRRNNNNTRTLPFFQVLTVILLSPAAGRFSRQIEISCLGKGVN
jgi:hypothetical protein